MDLSEYLNKIRREIDKSSLSTYANQLHEKTGISPEIYIVGVGILLVIMLFFDIFANIICDLIAYSYPLYASLKVIETNDHGKDTQWLTYWVVFGIFGTLETFIHIITYWIPFYYPLKVTFLIWCMHPTYNGATTIYNNFLKDFVRNHLEKVDAVLSEVNTSKIMETVASAVTPNSTTTSSTES